MSASAFAVAASGDPDRGGSRPFRCAESLWVAPRCVKRNGVSIALERPEDTRLLYLQIRRFHSTKEMVPATSNRAATPPMMAFVATLTCDGFDGMFVVVVLRSMFFTGILHYEEVSQE